MKLIIVVCLSFVLLACGLAVEPNKSIALSQAALNTLADKLHISVGVQNNVNVETCPDQQNTQCYLASFKLRFPEDLTNNDWLIYFSQTSPIQWDGSEEFDIVHINGDLHVIKPLAQHFVAGQNYTIPFKGQNSVISEAGFMPNYFIVADQLSPRLILATVEVKDLERQIMRLPHVRAFTQPQQTLRSSVDHTPRATAEFLYARHAQINAQSDTVDPLNNRIIPQLSESSWQAQTVSLQNGLNVNIDSQQDFSAALALLAQKGVVFAPQGLPLHLIKSEAKELGQQGYWLEIQADKISLSANSDGGLFYAIVSLAQLLVEADLSLPLGSAKDIPQYDFRGLHVDIARNFRDKTFILKLLTQMASYKLNKLHLHMADDEGWRLEIPGLEELTEIAAFRCFDLSELQCLQPQLGSGPFRETPVNGFLSTEDYIEIVRFANDRQIEVLPAIDMPGHSRAAVKAMQARYHKYKQAEDSVKAEEYLLTDLADKSVYSSIQYYHDNTLNPCLPSTYRFVEKIIDEVSKLHVMAGVPLKRYHIGADETAGAWKDSQACQQLISDTDELSSIEQLTPYFVAKVSQMVSAKGLIPGAWSDGLSHVAADKLPANVQANIWDTLYWQGHNRAHEFANRNWDTILSLPDVLYFDFPYQSDPLENGYYWGSRYTDSFQVFQFMPENLPAMAELWPDRMGDGYAALDTTIRQNNNRFSGIQAQLWSETVRADDTAEYMLFPRLIAFAERAWHKAEWALPYQAGQTYSAQTQHFSESLQQQQLADWAAFSDTLLKRVLPALSKDQVFFRLPTPGGKIVAGMLHANSYLPGLGIQYRETGQDWQDYDQPVAVGARVELRSILKSVQQTSRNIEVSER